MREHESRSRSRSHVQPPPPPCPLRLRAQVCRAMGAGEPSLFAWDAYVEILNGDAAAATQVQARATVVGWGEGLKEGRTEGKTD
eukprot:4921048-Pleurochrysis_carterae.AAC.2